MQKCIVCHKEIPKMKWHSTNYYKRIKFCSFKCMGMNIKGKHPLKEFKKGNPPPKHKDNCKCFRCHPLRGIDNPKWQGGRDDSKYNRIRRNRKYNVGGTHTRGEWETLKVQYNYTCPCCGRKEPEIKLTEDHIIPLAKGGSDNIENIQPLCKSCNCRKQTKIIKY